MCFKVGKWQCWSDLFSSVSATGGSAEMKRWDQEALLAMART
jgi:hypothetical protein